MHRFCCPPISSWSALHWCWPKYRAILLMVSTLQKFFQFNSFCSLLPSISLSSDESSLSEFKMAATFVRLIMASNRFCCFFCFSSVDITVFQQKKLWIRFGQQSNVHERDGVVGSNNANPRDAGGAFSATVVAEIVMRPMDRGAYFWRAMEPAVFSWHRHLRRFLRTFLLTKPLLNTKTYANLSNAPFARRLQPWPLAHF